jgi:hypothetical protein
MLPRVVTYYAIALFLIAAGIVLAYASRRSRALAVELFGGTFLVGGLVLLGFLLPHL